jgi:hypothetical protein
MDRIYLPIHSCSLDYHSALFSTALVIMMAILYDSIVVSAAVTFGLFLLKILVLNIVLYKMGKIQNWPKKVSRKKTMLCQCKS